jgi:F-box protein 11
MKKPPPAAFLSYVRSDDKYGHITEFRQRLSDEVHVQTGEEFLIFQDRNDILWGQNWKQRIEESIDEVTFLTPIITPSFFNSPACRDELERFLEREKELQRDDLILPVYYVDCPLLNDAAKQAKDKLAQVVAERQYADWRDLRFEPFTTPQVSKMFAQLAVQIREALERTSTPAKPVATGAPRRAGRAPSLQTPESTESATETGETRRRLAQKTEPPTLVVDPMHRGDHPTITQAIQAAAPGDRILVRPGLYQESLVIEKPLEIIGDGDAGEVIVQATGQNALLFKTTMGRVANLTLRQMGDGEWFGVDIAQGRLELEDCDVTSHSLACVGIHGGADPRLRRNRIHGGNQSGVFVYKNGQGTLEDNDIFGNAYHGVSIAEGGSPTLRRNRIHDGKQNGVYAYNAGQGTLEDNDIFANARSGVQIKTGGNPMLRRNRIHDGKQSGVFVNENGLGTLEDNDIFGNAVCGVSVATGGNPTFRRRINRNGYEAVWIQQGAAGTFEDNDLRHNGTGAWDISTGSEANVTRTRNLE